MYTKKVWVFGCFISGINMFAFNCKEFFIETEKLRAECAQKLQEYTDEINHLDGQEIEIGEFTSDFYCKESWYVYNGIDSVGKKSKSIQGNTVITEKIYSDEPISNQKLIRKRIKYLSNHKVFVKLKADRACDEHVAALKLLLEKINKNQHTFNKNKNQVLEYLAQEEIVVENSNIILTHMLLVPPLLK